VEIWVILLLKIYEIRDRWPKTHAKKVREKKFCLGCVVCIGIFFVVLFGG